MDRPNATAPEPFDKSLGEFLLVAYAEGEAVEGEWQLLDVDPMVPDVVVRISRVDTGPPDSASQERAAFSPSGPTDFKARLQQFVLKRFAEGDDVEGTWVIRYARPSLPDWEVTLSTSADSESVDACDETPSRE